MYPQLEINQIKKILRRNDIPAQRNFTALPQMRDERQLHPLNREIFILYGNSFPSFPKWSRTDKEELLSKPCKNPCHCEGSCSAICPASEYFIYLPQLIRIQSVLQPGHGVLGCLLQKPRELILASFML